MAFICWRHQLPGEEPMSCFPRSAALPAMLTVLLTLSAGSTRAAVPVSRVPVTSSFNVYLMDTNGGGRRAVTTLGTPYTSRHPISYPAYAWSPDGRYLLLIKQLGNTSRAQLLLLDPGGAVVGRLGIVPSP